MSFKKAFHTKISIFIFLVSISFSNSLCNFNVKMKQNLHNNGFHRNITYGIVFNGEDDEKWMYEDCIVGIDQILPPGVYCNPDELSELKRAKKLNAVPKSRVNVELTAEQSTSYSVLIFGQLTNGKLHIWLPVHARYHSAVPGGGDVINEIQPPDLYLHCPDQRLKMCDKEMLPGSKFLCNGNSNKKCSWKALPYTMMTDKLKWNVPRGNKDDYYIVAIGTGSCIIIGSLYLLYTIHKYKVNFKKKRN